MVVPIHFELKQKILLCVAPIKPYLVLDHNGRNLYLFSDQNLRDYTLWGGTYTYIPYIREFPFSLPSPGFWHGHKKNEECESVKQ